MKRWWWVVFALLTACASAPPLSLSERPIVLLGEVHDNAGQHALRLQAFRELLATGARPALLMEQFDRERQGDLDRARAAGADADGLVAAASSGAAWKWVFYKPFVDEALRHGLPIVAANVSRADARKVMGDGLAATGFEATVPPEITAALADTIERSHCGQVDATMAQRLVLAQVARDQFMARSVEAHAARGVVLLAGNGHVRSDIGVPRWLSPATRAQTLVIGLLEAGDDGAAAYDRVVRTAAQPREDPCKAR